MHSDAPLLPFAPRHLAHGPSRLGNYLKTAVLLAGLSALALAVGQRLGGASGLLFAGTFVLVMNLASYWFSDRIALAIHRAEPLEAHELPWLHEIVRALAQRGGLPMPRLYVIPTDTPNAFATGRNPSHAAVAVTEGALRLLERRELAGVLAHELAHVANRDTLISTVAATLAGLISHAAQMIFWFGGAVLGGRHDDDDDRGSALGNLGLLLVAPVAATLLQLAVSRSREYAADETGAALCGDPLALADALAKIHRGVELMPYNRAPATSHLFIVNPLAGSGVLSLFSTHPPVEERVRRLRAMVSSR
jgi:heat shock protein HtpX